MWKICQRVKSSEVSADEIPIKILKESTFCFPELTNCINEPLRNKGTNLSNLLNPSNKANYRPVSILPLISKVFEKIMYGLLYKYIENFLNQLLYGFHKAHLIQNALFRLLQKMAKRAWLREAEGEEGGGGLLVQF